MAVDHNNPQSRDEEILIATIDGTEYNKLPQSRMEELLLELKETIEEGGGGGGTTNYNNLSNQPQVNGETLIGDKSGSDLGLVDAEEGKGLSTNDYDDTEKEAVAAATSAISAIKDGVDIDSFGDVETALSAIKDGSDIDSFGDVEVALLDKADVSDLGTAAAKDSTNSVTSGSTDLVESGAVKDAIDAAVAAAYHHAGTKTVAQLTHDLLIAANEGNVYNITDSGTTTSDFIEGIGKQIDAGDNVGICKVGNVYMFDLLSGLEDTSIFVQKSQTAGLLKNDGTVNTTIEDTVAGHTTAIAAKQPITDNSLETTDKTIPGAINELKSNISTLESGLTNVEADVKLNTNDLTMPSRTKNLLPMTLNSIKSANTAGTWSGNDYTLYDVTFTVQTDGNGNVLGITVSGTASHSIYFAVGTINTKAGIAYTLTGCPSGGSNNNYYLGHIGTSNDRRDFGSGKDFPVDGTDSTYLIHIFVANGYAVNSLSFAPMIRLTADTDPTFAPYIPSVESRIEDLESAITPIMPSSDVTYIPFGNCVVITGNISGNDDSSLPLGIPTNYYGVVMGRFTSNGKMSLYYVDSGYLRGWDGTTNRTFPSTDNITICGLLRFAQ